MGFWSSTAGSGDRVEYCCVLVGCIWCWYIYAIDCCWIFNLCSEQGPMGECIAYFMLVYWCASALLFVGLCPGPHTRHSVFLLISALAFALFSNVIVPLWPFVFVLVEVVALVVLVCHEFLAMLAHLQSFVGVWSLFSRCTCLALQCCHYFATSFQ